MDKERRCPRKLEHEQRPSAGPGLMLGMATLGFALCFWAWALLSPLAVSFTAALHLTSFQQSLLVAVPVVVGSLGRIPVGALTDRFGGRVMFPIISLVDRRPGAVPRAVRPLQPGRAAGRWLLPRHRRHRVRRRGAVRQRVVPAGASRLRGRRVRRRHGRHRDQRADHRQAGQRPLDADAVRDHGRRADGVRRGRGAGPARRPRAGRAHRVAGSATGRCGVAADHLAGRGPLRDRLRRLRRLQRLPPHLSEERLRPHPRGRVEPDGRLRRRRRPDAAGRRLALRPGPGRLGADRRLRRRRRRRVGPVDDPGLAPVGTIVFLSMAGALGTASGATFALVAQRSRPPRSAPSPASSVRPAASVVSSHPW